MSSLNTKLFFFKLDMIGEPSPLMRFFVNLLTLPNYGAPFLGKTPSIRASYLLMFKPKSVVQIWEEEDKLITYSVSEVLVEEPVYTGSVKDCGGSCCRECQ